MNELLFCRKIPKLVNKCSNTYWLRVRVRDLKSLFLECTGDLKYVKLLHVYGYKYYDVEISNVKH